MATPKISATDVTFGAAKILTAVYCADLQACRRKAQDHRNRKIADGSPNFRRNVLTRVLEANTFAGDPEPERLSPLWLVGIPYLMWRDYQYPLQVLRLMVLANPNIPDRDIAAALSGEGDIVSGLWQLVPKPTGSDAGEPTGT